MNAVAKFEVDFSDIIAALAGPGIGVFPNFIDSQIVASLRHDVLSLGEHELSPAGIGRAHALQTNGNIRSDKTRWLEGDRPIQQYYLALMSRLKHTLNRELFLGLKDYECHYALYQTGDFYKKHLDAFRGRSNRRITTVLYLNDDWQVEHGGELVVYAANGTEPVHRILPSAGTLVCFLADEFPHEVLPAHRDRLSIAGWFRIDDPIAPSLCL
ncbi:2OG-Fe(II) oxygenase [Oceanisphaera avium]|uniref:2OG-Fe(II) oxygenase n=1 Tax=Oceanisphaera avium TaxID=1903694 RepID=UPI001E51693F|nr:2OG-Fe(II) oxygenase [Oceanisphaera avium]